MGHPLAELIGLRALDQAAGRSTLQLSIDAQHLNPHRVAHGAVLDALADTGTGAALYPQLATGELCATIEIKICYFKAVRGGQLECRTELVNRGQRVANLESRIYLGELLMAQANGHFAIFTAGAAAP